MAPFQSDIRARVTYDVIPPERSLHRMRGKVAQKHEIEDAEFEVVAPQPRDRRHETINDNARTTFKPRTQSSPRERFGLAAASSTAEAPVSGSRLPHFGLAGLAVAFLLTLGIAAFFNIGAFATADGGLVITEIRQSPIDSNGLRVMELSGIVENRSPRAQPLPALVAQMKSDNGTINQSAISLGDGLLASGATARFTLRIPTPGGKRQEVSISFAPKGV